MKWLDGPPKYSRFEELGAVPQRQPPSIEKSPELELKVLPSHLRYKYLGENKILPVIVAAKLT